MIRRFETYAFVPDTAPELRRRVAEVLGHCHRFIPEVVHNAVGWNTSGSATELAWEHAYPSVEAYRRYMVHPYHADLIDRFVLPDSPERVVEPITGAGLFGYHCDEADFALGAGQARRVVLLRFTESGDGDIAAAAEAFTRAASRASAGACALFSVVGANTLANSWFDGETPMGPPAKWSHVWEQGYADLATLAAGADETGPDFLRLAGMERWSELRYEVLFPA